MLLLLLRLLYIFSKSGLLCDAVILPHGTVFIVLLWIRYEQSWPASQKFFLHLQGTFNGQKCLRLLVLWPRFMARAYEWVVWGTVEPNGKNPPIIRLKNSWNWLIILMPATVWQILNIKCLQWPETEVVWIFWICLENVVKSHQMNVFSAGFSHLEPVCGASAVFVCATHL